LTKRKVAVALLVVVGLVVATLSATTTRPARAVDFFPVNGCPEDSTKNPPCDGDDVVLQWNEQLLATIRANPASTGPTISSRALGVLGTAMYDAWSAYDPAKATLPNGNTEQPANDANKSKAISYAAYKTLVDLFPYRQSVYAGLMSTLYGPNFASDTSTPALTGNRAAQAVINYRHADGSNQTDNPDGTVSYPCTPGSATPCPYQPSRHWNEPTNPWHWQPLCVPLSATCKPLDSSGPSEQAPLTPQWGNIKSFSPSLAALEMKVPPPPKTTTDIATALADTDLRGPDVDRKKVIAEYWADGPRTEFPPGHMAVFAQFLCRKMRAGLDTDVKMFFALGNAVMDAGIAAWGLKYKYDFWRPITAIRYQYKDKDVTSWLGPNLGFGTVKGQQWMPYQALNVVTPPFPEYVSGHSTFSAAGNVIMVGFTGSDNFDGSVTIPAGWSKFEANTPANPVTLSWPTFTAMADQAGMSRRYGGIHFKSGDMQGRSLGNMVGQSVWSRAQSYFRGSIGYNN
jgi:PAP2 superfamily